MTVGVIAYRRREVEAPGEVSLSSVNSNENRRAVRIAAKTVRVITVPPVMALALFTLLWLHGGIIGQVRDYICSVVLLVVLPVSAYPLQRLLPSLREKGREAQRSLAMIMSVAGYVLGVVYALIFSTSPAILTLFLTYLISGTALLVINKLFGFKASGHACGLTGPLAALAYYTGWYVLIIGAVLLAAVVWSSLVMKRHTPLQLLVGGAVPVAVFALLVLLIEQ